MPLKVSMETAEKVHVCRDAARIIASQQCHHSMYMAAGRQELLKHKTSPKT